MTHTPPRVPGAPLAKEASERGAEQYPKYGQAPRAQDPVASGDGPDEAGLRPAGGGAGQARAEREETGTLSAAGVRAMFDRIAPVYDLMNRLITAGLDRRWRRLAAEAVVRGGDRVLDACCGTGDLALAAQRAGATSIVGLDFSPRMLARARRKSASIEWIEGDVLALPFEDAEFGAVTVGFGVRNVADLERALGELRRVLVPGGRLAILEITTPRGALAPFFRLWFDHIVPLLGRALRGGGAYSYLPASVRRFPGPDELATLMRGAGLGEVRYRLLAGGIVALHTGVAR